MKTTSDMKIHLTIYYRMIASITARETNGSHFYGNSFKRASSILCTILINFYIHIYRLIIA